MTWHHDLPWQTLRYWYRRLRAALFSRPRPKGPYLEIGPFGEDVSAIEMVRSALGKQGWAPNWEQSYHKRGEELNLASVYWDRQEVDGEAFVWWQHHARGWTHDDGSCWLTAHEELEPTETPVGHLEGVGWDRPAGVAALRYALETAGIDVETVEWPADA
jgi:hypothetical protein